ncbi:hypothetical protein GQ457_01G027190 [Hibiscus cannabinus]
MHLVILGNMVSFITIWHDSYPVMSKDYIWHVIPIVITWSIWILRNKIAFKKGKVDVLELSFVTKFIITSWFKVKFSRVVIFLMIY